MESDAGEKTGQPETIGPVKIEWNWDFDDQWHEMKSIRAGDREYSLGKESRFRLKGRCRRCWGGLIGKDGAESVPTAIRCRVCGILLEGDAAKEEYERMSKQSGWNTFNMALGIAPEHRDGATYPKDATFVQKIFPHIDRQPEDEFVQRTEFEASKGSVSG